MSNLDILPDHLARGIGLLQCIKMRTTQSDDGFWSEPDVVAAYSSSTSALPYEVELVSTAVDMAARTGPVKLIHVIGVGGGRELGAVRDAAGDASIRAWDISVPMIDACREHIESNGWSNVHADRADLVELSPTDGVADVVIALSAVLGFLTTEQERIQGFDTIRSLLRPGGTVALVVQQRTGRPDWALWLGLRGCLTKLRIASGGPGDRRSKTANASIMFHHFTARELTDLLERNGFGSIKITSLRAWARSNGNKIPLRSPNPLIATATRKEPNPAHS